MARIVWSSVARDDLKSLVSFIKADSPGYAQTFGLHIQQRVEQLHRVPESGRKVPEDSGRFRKIKAVRTGNSLWGTTGLSIEWTRIPSPS